MGRQKEKPGMMIYWSMFDALENLLDGQAKIMLHAMRNYSQYGEIPDFENDPVLRTLWFIVKPQIDADTERYEKIKQQRTDAANSRWDKEHSEKECESMRPYTDECESMRPYTDECGSIRSMPITNTITIPDTNTLPDTVSVAETHTAPDAISNTDNGKNGNNVKNGGYATTTTSMRELPPLPHPKKYCPQPTAAGMDDLQKEITERRKRSV